MLLRTRRTPSGFIEPCLPSPANHPPSGPGWIHEITHDGFRLMARRDAAGVRLLTRVGGVLPVFPLYNLVTGNRPLCLCGYPT